jgi:hypothetical protein
MKHKDRELSLKELELVRGGFNYSGFYRYRAEILNTHQIKSKSPRDDYLYDSRGAFLWPLE